MGKLDVDYQVSCELPNERVGGLIGRKGDHVQHVEQATGTKITFHEEQAERKGEARTRNMTIVGPLISVYAAHMMMMKQYHEDAEREAEREHRQHDDAPRPEVENLKAQLEALQGQLQAIEGDKGGASRGGGKSRKGGGKSGRR